MKSRVGVLRPVRQGHVNNELYDRDYFKVLPKAVPADGKRVQMLVRHFQYVGSMPSHPVYEKRYTNPRTLSVTT